MLLAERVRTEMPPDPGFYVNQFINFSQEAERLAQQPTV